MKTKVVQGIVALGLILSLTGCYVQTDVTLTPKDELYLTDILISIDSGGGPEIIESSVRHALNLLGLRDSFDIVEYKSRDFTMENYLQLKPTEEIPIEKVTDTGDQITITPIGDGQRKLEWLLEQRTQVFASNIGEDDPEDANKVFLIVRIHFPGPVDMANTSENKGNQYTWRITKGQMAEPFKIQAIYSLQEDDAPLFGSSQ